MQSTPSEAAHAASRTDAPDDATVDTVLPERTPGSTIALVLRPRVQWWLPGPLFLIVAAALVASGRTWGVVAALIAVPFLSVLWLRIEVGEHAIRRRGWRGWSTIRTDSLDAMRLRRIAFGTTRWLGRGYRIGRFWSVPLTLRLMTGDQVRLELRCVWWNDWRSLARFAASLPGVELDERTRGRLDRYVGPIAFATSVQR